MLLEPKYAAPILILGKAEGWFTGKKLSDYITLQKFDFRNGRRSVNRMDKADLIAGYAREYDKLLLAEGYGVDQVVEAPVNDIVPAPDEPEKLSRSKGSGLGFLTLPQGRPSRSWVGVCRWFLCCS